MVVHTISLQNFRNFTTLDMPLAAGTNIFYGSNAQGKTNLLESIYFCATGRSQRAKQDKELIQFGAPSAHVQIITKQDATAHAPYDNKIAIHLQREGKKAIAVNGVPIRKLSELFGVLLAVIFSPEDLQLVKAGPSERRRFIDMELCQISKVYCYDLQQYYHILKQRNNLLKAIKLHGASRDTLFLWDEQLVQIGIKIISHRRVFIDNLNTIAGNVHAQITNGSEHLQMIYRPNVSGDDFLDRLHKSVDRDIALGTTNVGLHKDDLTFLINDIDARVYGSQGQQRTASLSAKLAEIDMIKEQKQCAPVLLLDDVLSELDESRQAFLMQSIKGIQSIITCTGVEDVIGKVSSTYSLYKVDNGFITHSTGN